MRSIFMKIVSSTDKAIQWFLKNRVNIKHIYRYEGHSEIIHTPSQRKTKNSFINFKSNDFKVFTVGG